MTAKENVIYTGITHTTSGGRNGQVQSSDGRLNIQLSTPGASGRGTNPEQLFAAGWSACFIGAMGIAAKELKVALPSDLSVYTEVDLCRENGEYFLQARLNVHLPHVDLQEALQVVNKAHQTCPYSKATRDNFEVEINVV